MASDVKHGKGYTAPKGRPTVHSSRGRSTRRLSSTVEWVLATIAFLAVLAAIFYFGRNFTSGGGGGGADDVPADAPVVQLYDAGV